MASTKATMLLLAVASSLLISTSALSCLPCEEVEKWCPQMLCEDGVDYVKDICGCCDVCAAVEGDNCGGWTDTECNSGLICAKELPPAFIPGPRLVYHMEGESTGTCQNPDNIHKCQFPEELCSYNGDCVPDGDDYQCRCHLGWTGDSCDEKQVLRPRRPKRPRLMGGWGKWEDADETIQDICNIIREEVESKLDTFKMFKAVSYKSQVVAGMNYKIKVDVGAETFVKISVYQGFSSDVKLNSARMSKELVPPPIITEECEHNKVWQECGTACPLKCGEEAPMICTMQCVIGCQCPPGYWEDVDGSCVEDDSLCTPSEECPFNQEWQQCATPCPKTCGAPVPELCIEMCIVGCACPPDMWQNEDGSCVEDESQCDLSDCRDGNEQCSGWAESGECCKNPGYMLDNCAKSCGQCGSNPDLSCGCENLEDDASCDAWAEEGECCKNEDYMLEHCKKSCAQCGELIPVPGCPCMNHDLNCNGWAEAGECEKNPGFMKDHCAAACGECIPEPQIEEVCPFNKEWKECGTACPLVCGEEEPLLCTMNCVIGCQCPDGFWEQQDGSCVQDESDCVFIGTLPPLPPIEDACSTNPCDEECYCQNAPEMDDGYVCACPSVDPIPEYESYVKLGEPLYFNPEEEEGQVELGEPLYFNPEGEEIKVGEPVYYNPDEDN